MKRLREHKLELDTLLGLRWDAFQTGNWAEAMADQPSPIQQVGPIEAGMMRGLLTASSSSEKEYSVTTEILVSIKIAYDLGELCPTEVVEAVEEVKEKASELGSVEEISLTTDGSLDVDLNL